MSIGRIIALGVQRQQELQTPQATIVRGEEKKAKLTVQSALDELSAFIPAEAIGIYVAWLAYSTPQPLWVSGGFSGSALSLSRCLSFSDIFR